MSKFLAKEFSVGLLALHFRQVSGTAARATVLSGTIAYAFYAAGTPVPTRIKVLRQVENRFRGPIRPGKPSRLLAPLAARHMLPG